MGAGAAGRRMFVAAVPTEAVRAGLDDFLVVRRDAAAFRWTLAEQFHVTLAFCADVPDRVLDDFGERLGRAASKRAPIDTRLAGGGAFPDAARARVLYAGLALEDPHRTELTRLAAGARAAAAKAGADADGQRFRPHLTVARLGRPADASNWVRLLDAYAGPPWRIDEVALVASHLGEGPRNRPRHETLATFPLGS